MTQKNEMRPLYRRPWFIALAVLIGLGVLGSKKERRAGGEGESTSAASLPSTNGRSGAMRNTRGEPTSGDRGSGEGTKPDGGAGSSSPTDLEVDDATPEPESPATAWRYHESEDAMTGHVTRFASVTSENEYELDFPYQGGTRASLTLRQHPRHGVDVLATINRGQLLCNMFSGCRVLVRFDDRPPIKFKGTESSDHDNHTIFLAPTAKLIKEARRSKKAAIELEFFQSGSKVFFFDVEGLEWE